MTEQATKFCKKCGQDKPLINFCFNKNRADGLQIYCRPCMRDSARPSQLLRNFGIPVEQYDEMLEKQKGVCPICGNKPQKNRFPVDHDHATGAVRGLLCIRCNMNLEWFIDNRSSVEEYLDKGVLV